MNLESVRELKFSLAQTVLAGAAEAVRARAAFGVASQELSGVKEIPRSLALGIAPRGKEDFRLAVRIQHRAMEQSPEVELIRKQAKGEVECAISGG